MDDPRSPAFPVHQKKLNVEIEGNKTDIVICSYDDHFFVLATQIGSMGTILHARKEEAFLADPTFEVSIAFGKYDEPMIVLCGRQLIEHISKSGSSKPLILSLGLKDHSMATVKGIISAVTENCLWGPEPPKRKEGKTPKASKGKKGEVQQASTSREEKKNVGVQTDDENMPDYSKLSDILPGFDETIPDFPDPFALPEDEEDFGNDPMEPYWDGYGLYWIQPFSKEYYQYHGSP